MWKMQLPLALLVGLAMFLPQAVAQQGPDLKEPSAFSDIGDRAARSRALFSEGAKVITSPRCMNCHPAGDQPHQGDDRHIHRPLALRGEANNGVPRQHCAACHTDNNFPLSVGAASYQSVPGHARWSLAPSEMAWEGKTPGEICRQIKDPARNGGRDLALLREHGITAYLKNGWSLENAAAMANHAFDPHHAALASPEARGDPRRGGADFDLKDFQRLLFVTRSRGPVDGTSLSLVNSMSS
jgi:hypothetical protein